MSWKTMSKREAGSSASRFLCSNNNAKDENICRVIGKFITTGWELYINQIGVVFENEESADNQF